MSLSCLVCHGKKIDEVVKDHRRYFHCESCKRLYERALDSTYGRDVAINTEEGVQHIVSSALIWEDGKFILIKRRSYPFGFTFPGGHLEYDEKPMDALKREILEETGLKIQDATLIFNETLDITKCRYGADNHIWYFYKCKVKDTPLILNPESESVGWYTKEEAMDLDLTPSARHILEHISI